VEVVSQKPERLSLFDHLPKKLPMKNSDLVEGDRILHPATIKLGALYSKGMIQADDDRVTSLVAVFCNLIQDYKTPPKKVLREDLDKYISKQVQHLVESRELSRGMGNLIKYMRFSVSKISPEISEAEAKHILLEKLQSFLEERIVFAAENIAKYVISTIRDGDVILTFGSSPLVRKVLLLAAKTKSFRLVVVDSRPLNEGLATLTALSHKVHCVYSPLSGAAAAMQSQHVTRVLLGASSLLSNGAMLGPAGTAMVAALAKARQIPVIVAAESYKCSEKVQLDSIVFNELGHPAEIAVMGSVGNADGSSSVGPVPQRQPGYRGAATSSPSEGTGADQQQQAMAVADPISLPTFYAQSSEGITNTTPLPFNVVNLRYDLTPIGNISVVATETGLTPPTSIPVLMREMQQSQQQQQQTTTATTATSSGTSGSTGGSHKAHPSSSGSTVSINA